MKNCEIIFLNESTSCIIYDKPVVLAIGVFDGVHAGHRKLIQETIVLSSEVRADPGVFTFWPHPSHVLSGCKPKEIILHKKEKYEKIFECGIKVIFEQCFDNNFANLSPEDFFSLLTKKINVCGVCVGDDFKFGKNHAGDVRILQKIASDYKIEVKIVDRLRIDGNIVSSSLIRKNIANGGKGFAGGML